MKQMSSLTLSSGQAISKECCEDLSIAQKMQIQDKHSLQAKERIFDFKLLVSHFSGIL